MDEKGDAAVAMEDDEPENSEISDMVADAPTKPVAMWTMSERIAEQRGEKRLADGQKVRISIREKLAEMKEKTSGQKLLDKTRILKNKEESL